MRTKSLIDYLEHLSKISCDHKVHLVFDPMIKPHEATCVPDHRLVQSHPVIDDITYVVVLHEIGHLLGPGGHDPTCSAQPRTVRDMMRVVDQEDAAWQWARINAIEWTAAMDYVYHWARETYRKRLEDYVKASIPSVTKNLKYWR